ncbi:uncharacterized protein DS421_19g656170 [Arachis hypogaea]|uniref:Uncharacterized protein n=1 Tax=Arachis hypogaea TaxID=3818 RepID=A0A6B9VAQ0_ARAHY|nr:uncharacterized protein DS421_19g656170 [Arachis hypogaea]
MIEQSSPKTQFYQTSQLPPFLTIHIPTCTKPFKTSFLIKIHTLRHITPFLLLFPLHFNILNLEYQLPTHQAISHQHIHNFSFHQYQSFSSTHSYPILMTNIHIHTSSSYITFQPHYLNQHSQHQQPKQLSITYKFQTYLMGH